MPASVVLCTASYDHTIRFWEAPTAHCYRSLQYNESQINRLQITPDKTYLAAAANPHIKLYEINSNNPSPLRSFESHTGNVTALGFHKENKWMFSSSEDRTVKIWDIRAAGCQRDYESSAAINDAVLHPNQGEILSGDLNGNIRVWDLTANACRYELELEREEKALPEQADAAMCDSDSGDDSLDEDEAELWTTVVKKKNEMMAEARVGRNQNKQGFPRKAR
eukprot:490338_1